MVTLNEIENLFRSSLELEGSDINHGGVSKFLLECQFWRNHISNSTIKTLNKTQTSPAQKALPTAGRGRGKAASTTSPSKTLPPSTRTTKNATRTAKAGTGKTKPGPKIAS